ncbi:hypothetical protein FKM82_029870 [Ascaphus truei]
MLHPDPHTLIFRDTRCVVSHRLGWWAFAPFVDPLFARGSFRTITRVKLGTILTNTWLVLLRCIGGAYACSRAIHTLRRMITLMCVRG